MSQVPRGPRVFVHAAANYLGYQVPKERPARGDKKAQERSHRGIKCFHQAIIEGRAPPADGRAGRFLWWYQSTLDAWIAKSSNTVKRGRKAKAEVADATAA
jgi:hypothetical protein